MIAKTSPSAIADFLDQQQIAVFGVSRSGKKFGNSVFRQLREAGKDVYAIHPGAPPVEGGPSYPDLKAVPVRVDAAVIVIPPAQAAEAVRECVAYGVKHIWLQKGAESDSAILFCTDHGVEPIHGECILLFTEPVRSIHKVHRTLRRWFGNLPVTEG